MDGEIIIPAWLARSLVPMAILSALGASFSVWIDVHDMGQHLDRLAPKIASFEEFKLRGKRFTLRDGEGLRKKDKELEMRIDKLEHECALTRKNNAQR